MNREVEIDFVWLEEREEGGEIFGKKIETLWGGT